MTHDEARYPNPFNFDPERFLDAEGNLTQDTVGYAFGFGRRLACWFCTMSSEMTRWLLGYVWDGTSLMPPSGMPYPGCSHCSISPGRKTLMEVKLILSRNGQVGLQCTLLNIKPMTC